MLNTNLSVLITSKCTLNCKYCSSGVPYYTLPKHIPAKEIVDSICRALDLYRAAEMTINHLDLLGGEPLLNPELPEILHELPSFTEKLPEIRILTNCTLLPDKRLIKAVKEIEATGIKFLFILGNYGEISPQYEKVVAILDKYEIRHRTDVYSGDSQYFDGWVSYGQDDSLVNNAGQTYEECAFCRSGVLEMYDGKLYPCVRLLALNATGRISSPDEEYIDLTHHAKVNRQKLISYTTRNTPYSICSKCSGLGKNSRRYQAAEQRRSKE